MKYQNVETPDVADVSMTDDDADQSVKDDDEDKKDDDGDDEEDDDKDGDKEEEESKIDSAEEKDKPQRPAQRRKTPIGSLLVHLNLFASLKKVRSMMKTEEVSDTFFELLKNRNPAVQKAAFECVMVYKSPHLTPYR